MASKQRGRLWGLQLQWLVLLLLQVLVKDVHGLQQHQTDGRAPFIVPLHTRHGVPLHRGRVLLRHGSLPILGAVREGYFYAKIELGTPPRSFSVIIDTGSTITYVPCSDCRHCGKHTDMPFDPATSSTSKLLSCTDDLCNCGEPACNCKQSKCYYERHYAERSSSEGWLLQDLFRFPDNSSAVNVVFGCETFETGEIYRQAADGIMGMGNSANAFHGQLSAVKATTPVFSLCFGFPSGGAMLLGDTPPPPGVNGQLAFTPVHDPEGLHYFNVQLTSMSINGRRMKVDMAPFQRGYGTVMDSGTTFVYLPTGAFAAFEAALTEAVQGTRITKTPGPDPQYHDVCFKGAPENFVGLEQFFPTIVMTFAGNTSLHLLPYRYLFLVGRGEYCLGVFDNGDSGALIGGIAVRNVLVQYDTEHARIGFAEAECNSLWSAPAAAPPAAPRAAAGEQQPSASPDAALQAATGGPGPEATAAGQAAQPPPSGTQPAGGEAQAAGGAAQAAPAPGGPAGGQQGGGQGGTPEAAQPAVTPPADEGVGEASLESRAPQHGWPWFGGIMALVLLCAASELAFWLHRPLLPGEGGVKPPHSNFMRLDASDECELAPMAASPSTQRAGIV